MRKLLFGAIALAAASGASAAITWTDWTAAAPGGVAGTMGSVTVTGTTVVSGFHN